jgi:hypothetical protein
MKEITLKEACEILDKADAVIVHNGEGRLASPLQNISFETSEEGQSFLESCSDKLEDLEECIESDCDCCSDGGFFLVLGDIEHDEPFKFPAEHNTQVKIDADGDLLLHEFDKSKSVKISILTKKNLNTP